MRIVLCAVAVATLAGCAGMRPRYEPSKDPTTACIDALKVTPAAAVLSSKAVLNGLDSPTVEMLSDNTYATEAEKVVISKYSLERARCAHLGVSYRESTIPPQIRLTRDQNWDYTTTLLAKLFGGQMTWGAFNAERGRSTREAQQNVANIASRMDAEDQARRQQAAAAFSNALYQQQQIQLQQQMLNQQIYQQNRPVQTNCQRFGSQVSCTTY